MKIIMEIKNKELVPFKATHPGIVLQAELEARGIKHKAFATLIGVQESRLSEFINGKRKVTPELAEKLEETLGISYDFWLRFQNRYDYNIIQIAKRDEMERHAMSDEEKLGEKFNLTLIYKYLKMQLSSAVERMRCLTDMGIMKMNLKTAGYFKHSSKVAFDLKNVRSWVFLAIYTVKEGGLKDGYEQGNAVLAANDIARKANAGGIDVAYIKQTLNDYGIAYYRVKKLDKAPIDAFSTRIDGKYAIVVTYRYNDMDKLVFDVLHELCHIDRHFTDDNELFISIEGAEYADSAKEREANEFARNTLIPQNVWRNILKADSNTYSPYKVVPVIARQAEKAGISPSIAVSRYKKETSWYKTSLYRSAKIY